MHTLVQSKKEIMHKTMHMRSLAVSKMTLDPRALVSYSGHL